MRWVIWSLGQSNDDVSTNWPPGAWAVHGTAHVHSIRTRMHSQQRAVRPLPPHTGHSNRTREEDASEQIVRITNRTALLICVVDLCLIRLLSAIIVADVVLGRIGCTVLQLFRVTRRVVCYWAIDFLVLLLRTRRVRSFSVWVSADHCWNLQDPTVNTVALVYTSWKRHAFCVLSSADRDAHFRRYHLGNVRSRRGRRVATAVVGTSLRVLLRQLLRRLFHLSKPQLQLQLRRLFLLQWCACPIGSRDAAYTTR